MSSAEGHHARFAFCVDSTALQKLDGGDDKAELTEKELGKLYSPSQWCKRLTADTVVKDHCKTLAQESAKLGRFSLTQENPKHSAYCRWVAECLEGSFN